MSQPPQPTDPAPGWTRGTLEWDPKAGPFTNINKPKCHQGGFCVAGAPICDFGDAAHYYPTEGTAPSPANIARLCDCWNKLAEHDDLDAVEVVPKGTLQELTEIRDYLWPNQTGLPHQYRNALICMRQREELSKKRLTDLQQDILELEELKNSHSQMCARLQACVQKHQIGLGGEKLDMLVTTEIDNMRKAIQEAHALIIEAIEPDQGISLNQLRSALHKLGPHTLRP